MLEYSSCVHGGSCWAASWASPDSKGRSRRANSFSGHSHTAAACLSSSKEASGSSVEADLVSVKWTDGRGHGWRYSGLQQLLEIIYFGGYGHKLLSEISNPGTFIVDEASWAEDIFWGWNSEVHVFDPGSKGWTEPQTLGHAPAPRAAHASATIGNKGYVCGGRIMETRKCDLHCLDLNTWIWSEIVPTSTLPLGRSWHTLNAVSDTALFLFGGLSVDCRPMRSHDYILLVDSGHCNDILVFQTQPYSLIRLCEDFIASSAKMFQTQLAGLPPKLRCSMQNRITFFRSTRKSRKVIRTLE
ncbi:hypothetical protein PGIGA_G00019880 [Pangasianodon gigas]|uniref:Uncharacterized protein n=1 Tax=Pangasianodon gigas TaxID=30993 RepID=A0ACC5WVS8_PANGG|nr:hypothetical protein [Pangasianodon gigas]